MHVNICDGCDTVRHCMNTKDSKPCERLLQDEVQTYETKRLARWFSEKLDARAVVRRFFGEKK